MPSKMVNGFGNFLNIKMPKIDINLGIDLKRSKVDLIGKTDIGLKLRPIDFGPSFTVTSKQGLIKPIKQSGSVQAAKVVSARRELSALQASKNDSIQVENRVKGILSGKLALEDVNNTDVLEASGLAKPTASKVRASIRDEQRGLLNRTANKSKFSNREFQVSFISDSGVIQVKTFRNREDARRFREIKEAEGALESASSLREVSV